MQQSLFPFSHPLNAVVTVPGSKSITNRALLLAALAQGTSELFGVLFSDDSTVMMAALRGLGVHMDVDHTQCKVKVHGVGGVFPVRNTGVYCQDAGTATRFLLAACAAQRGAVYDFSASERMMERPNGSLIRILQEQGAHITCTRLADALPLGMSAQGLCGGDVYVPLDESSQFLSGLLMAAPYAQKPVFLHAGDVQHKSYVTMTLAMMRAFGVDTTVHLSGTLQPHQGMYQGRVFAIEPDASTASYFFAAAALAGGCVTVPYVNPQGLQGDTQFLNVLEQMGCQVHHLAQGVKVTGPSVLRGCNVNMRGFSDTFMTVAALACHADAPSTLSGLAHTRLQESDRVAAMAEGLQRVGIRTETTQDSITVYPGAVHAGTVSSHRDHRIAMSLALLGLKTPGVVVDGAECVSKTCPDFFERMAALQ